MSVQSPGATPTVPVMAPAAPTGVNVTAANAKVTVTWTASAGSTSYNVYRSTVQGSRGSKIGSSSTTSFTDGSVVNGTTYYYEVTAANAAGESQASTQPPPGNPRGSGLQRPCRRAREATGTSQPPADRVGLGRSGHQLDQRAGTEAGLLRTLPGRHRQPGRMDDLELAHTCRPADDASPASLGTRQPSMAPPSLRASSGWSRRGRATGGSLLAECQIRRVRPETREPARPRLPDRGQPRSRPTNVSLTESLRPT